MSSYGGAKICLAMEELRYEHAQWYCMRRLYHHRAEKILEKEIMKTGIHIFEERKTKEERG